MSELREGLFLPQNLDGAPVLFGAFWSLWREEKFFECHEVLEDLWRQTPGDERWFYNALIHCAVAIYQHRRGNSVGAARQYIRARVKIAPFGARFGGVQIEPLLAAVQNEIANSLEALTERQTAQLISLEEHLHSKLAKHFPAGHFTGKWEEWYGR